MRMMALLAALMAMEAMGEMLPIDPFADRVLEFHPGDGFAVDFETGIGFTNTTAALGAPSKIIEGEFGGAITPFAPPFLQSQLLSIGEGGMAIFEFDPPLFNHPANPFGLDFILYGNSGFVITNGNFTGGGITSGNLFGQNTGATRISVSADGESYFELDSTKTPLVDSFYPTDGAGQAGIPVALYIPSNAFASANLEKIRSLYKGSAGGSGYDLDWARRADGTSMKMIQARFIKIEVLEGKSEIDALSAVLPMGGNADFSESFDASPHQNGWAIHGQSDLFNWDEANERLRVQWDSSQPNSYFYFPLSRVLSIDRDFSIGFDLMLDSIQIGTSEGKASTFPIAIGVADLAQAMREEYFRGSGIDAIHGARGVVEWNYFADSGFGATISSGLISQDNQWAYQNSFPITLDTGTTYHIDMNYSAEEGILRTIMHANDEAFFPIEEARLDALFGNPIQRDFTSLSANAFVISSYNDGGQSPPEFAGSLKASGYVDNIRVSSPLKKMRIDSIRLHEDKILLSFRGEAASRYWLEQSNDLVQWISMATLLPDEDGTNVFTIPACQGFFRINKE